MASPQERFQAAVNVIKGLPKNGPYQPSNSMMLKFYGLYKQATEGNCQQRKPAFWDVVNKAKWEAWNRNSHLTKEEAMQKYVENLQEIIETMSFTENVQDFVGSLQGLENINLDELEIIAPGMRELAQSHPSSPFHSRTNSPLHSINDHNENVNLNGHISTDNVTNSTTKPVQKLEQQSHSSQQLSSNDTNAVNYPQTNGLAQSDHSDDEYADTFDIQNELYESLRRNTDILKQVRTTVLRMNSDISSINQRVLNMERTLEDIKNAIPKQNSIKYFRQFKHCYGKWWPFADISPMWFALLILWPVIVRRAARIIAYSRKHK